MLLVLILIHSAYVVGTHQKLLSICCGYSLEAPKRVLWVLIRRPSTCPEYKTKHMFRVLIRSLSAYVVGIHLNPLGICCEYSSEAPQHMLWIFIISPSKYVVGTHQKTFNMFQVQNKTYVVGTHQKPFSICCWYSSKSTHHMLWVLIRSSSAYVVDSHQKPFNICCRYSSEASQGML